MSIEGTAVKQKCVTFNPQKLEIIKRHERGKNEREIMASYSFGLSTVSDMKKRKDQL
jgi:transposase